MVSFELERERALCLLVSTAACLFVLVGRGAGDSQSDVQTIVDRQIESGNRDITIPAGRYRVAPQAGRHLLLSGLTNVTVNATGAELVCTDYANALVVTNCSGLTVKGLSIDYDPLPWTQGRVTAVDAKARTAEVEIAEGYPDRDILTFKNQYFDATTRELLDLSGAAWFERLEPRRLRAHWKTGAKLPPKGALFVSNVAHPVMAKFLKGPDDYSRAIHAVVQVDSCETHFEDVTVWASPWFSFFERDCDGTVYERCRVDRRPSETDSVRRGMARLRASNSDAFHCTRAARGPKVKHCIAQYMEDDGVNVHGFYHFIASSQGCELRVLDQGGMNLSPGDAVELLDASGNLLPDAHVVSVRLDDPDEVTSEERARLRERDLRPYFREHWRPKAYRVTLDRAEPLAFGGVIVSLAQAGCGFEVTDCVLGHTRARGVLVRARDGLVARNEITDTGLPAVLLASEPWWLEGGTPLGTQVENNTVLRCRADPPIQRNVPEVRRPLTAGRGFEAQHARKLWVTYRSFNKELERTGQFAAMGITNRCFFAANTINSAGNPYCEYPPIWKGIGQYDWAALDAQVGDLVKASPSAQLMCMIDLNTPYWATHKFHLDSFTGVTHAACDGEWRRQTQKWMLDFIAYAEKRWGNRIGAYILSGGGTSEWYEYDRGRTSANKDAAWVRWCKARGLDYGETVPPRPALAKAAFENLVYDPKTEPEKIEYWKFHNSLPAEALLGFAKAARAAIPKTKEIGAFFGYFLVSDSRHTSFGHLDYERVYASPDIDFFIAPGNYSDRGIGGGSGSQLVDGTALRYGKRFLHEIDFGPHDQQTWGRGIWKTLADDLAGNTREVAFAMSKNASYWWFDMWGGFYRDPAVRARIAALRRAQESLPDAPSVAEVLLVADPESICHVNERNPGERAFGQAMRNALSRTGAPYDTCSFGDLDAVDLSPYRLVILNSTLLVTPEREGLLNEKVLTKGRTVVWTYAPGVTDGKTLDAARVKRFAGVAYATPGVSVTEMSGGWRAVYAFDYKLYTPEKLAEIETLAGVHRYVEPCTPVFAKKNLVAVHTAKGGVMKVRLRKRTKCVTDLLTGEIVAKDADSFETVFATPDTRLWLLDNENEAPNRRCAMEAERTWCGTARDVGTLLNHYVDTGRIAGVVSVTSDAEYRERYDCAGWADMEGGRKMTPDTLFAVFSMTKTFTGAAVMCAIDEGKLSLDDAVSKFLPEFADVKMKDGSRPKRRLTIRDMMCHVTGFRGGCTVTNRDIPLREVARRLAAQPLQFQPGETFAYGNSWICTAAACVEVATGVPFERYLQTKILDPLGMKDTTFWPNDEQVARLAKSYNSDNAKLCPADDRCVEQITFPKKTKICPAASGGLFSTPRDMVRFSQMLARHGEWKGKRVISRETFDRIFSVKQTPTGIPQPYTCGSWLYGDWFGHEGAMRTDQRANLKTGHCRVFFIQTQTANRAGSAFFRLKREWHNVCDRLQGTEPTHFGN